MRTMEIPVARRHGVGGVVSALAGAAGVLVVAPMLLIEMSRRRFGSPSPLAGLGPLRGWLDRVIAATGEPIDAGTLTDLVIRAGLVIGWAAVASVVFSLVAEVVSTARFGRVSVAAPAPGWSRSLARWIVGGVLALAPNLGQIGFAAATPGAPVVDVARGETAGDVVDDASTGPSSAVTGIWSVAPGDSLYAIAAVIASAADRDVHGVVDEIIELNSGRTMADGRAFEDPSLIVPGWELLVPTSMIAPASVSTPPVVADPSSVVLHEVAASDTLARIAAEQLGDPGRWTEVFEANSGRTMGDGRVFTDPDLIVPGWELVIPSVDGSGVGDAPSAEASVGRTLPASVDPTRTRAEHEAVASPVTIPDPVTIADPATVVDAADAAIATGATSGVAPDREPDAMTDVTPHPTSDRGSVAGWVEMAGTAMLGVGVVGALAVRRRRRLRTVPSDMVLLRPERNVVEFERAVVAEAVASGATDQMVTIDLAVRSAMAALGPADAGIVWLRITPDGAIALRPDRPVVPPVGWTVLGDEWTTMGVPVPLTGDGPFPCPVLCQIGVTGDGDEVFVDLERLGVLTVIGDDADRVVAGIAAAVAVSPFADCCPMIHVGPDEFSLGALGDIRSVRSTDLPAEWTAGTRPLPVAPGSVTEVRALDDDAWEPLVVFSTVEPVTVPETPDGHAPPVLVSVGSAPQQRGAVLRRTDDAVWEFAGDVDGPRIRVRPAMLERDAIELIGELLNGPEAVEGPVEVAGHALVTGVSRGASRAPALVRLLGDVRVESADGSEIVFERTKSVELLAWLVTHRERPTRTRARTALWETDVRAATFSNVVSDARRTLGRVVPLDDEREWIARTLTEELAVDDALCSDADLLRAARMASHALSGAEAVAVLRPALELVEGLPFSGSGYGWPDPEGITSELVVLATGAAADMARHCLDLGDLAGVVWATGQGLKVLPGHEELIALRLRARAATGDMAGVRQEWASYERVLADEWTGGEPAPELIELRRELLTARHGG